MVAPAHYCNLLWNHISIQSKIYPNSRQMQTCPHCHGDNRPDCTLCSCRRLISEERVWISESHFPVHTKGWSSFLLFPCSTNQCFPCHWDFNACNRVCWDYKGSYSLNSALPHSLEQHWICSFCSFLGEWSTKKSKGSGSEGSNHPLLLYLAWCECTNNLQCVITEHPALHKGTDFVSSL